MLTTDLVVEGVHFDLGTRRAPRTSGTSRSWCRSPTSPRWAPGRATRSSRVAAPPGTGLERGRCGRRRGRRAETGCRDRGRGPLGRTGARGLGDGRRHTRGWRRPSGPAPLGRDAGRHALRDRTARWCRGRTPAPPRRFRRRGRPYARLLGRPQARFLRPQGADRRRGGGPSGPGRPRRSTSRTGWQPTWGISVTRRGSGVALDEVPVRARSQRSRRRSTGARTTSWSSPRRRRRIFLPPSKPAGLTVPLSIGRCTEPERRCTLAGEPLRTGRLAPLVLRPGQPVRSDQAGSDRTGSLSANRQDLRAPWTPAGSPCDRSTSPVRGTAFRQADPWAGLEEPWSSGGHRPTSDPGRRRRDEHHRPGGHGARPPRHEGRGRPHRRRARWQPSTRSDRTWSSSTSCCPTSTDSRSSSS